MGMTRAGRADTQLDARLASCLPACQTMITHMHTSWACTCASQVHGDSEPATR